MIYILQNSQKEAVCLDLWDGMLTLGVLEEEGGLFESNYYISLLPTPYLCTNVAYYCRNLEFWFLQRVKEIIHTGESQEQFRALDVNNGRLGDDEHT